MRLANFIKSTKTHGPGNRSVVQFQGCDHGCRGCIAKETWDKSGGTEISAADLAKVVSLYCDGGLTVSGGEPFDQQDLYEFLAEIKRLRPDITIICFTGYTIKELGKKHGQRAVKIINLLDMLIDGRYVERLDTNIGIVGSSNQKVYRITDRLGNYNPLEGKRFVEWHKRKNSYLIVGVTDKEQKKIEESFFGT